MERPKNRILEKAGPDLGKISFALIDEVAKDYKQKIAIKKSGYANNAKSEVKNLLKGKGCEHGRL